MKRNKYRNMLDDDLKKMEKINFYRRQTVYDTHHVQKNNEKNIPKQGGALLKTPDFMGPDES